MAGDDERDRIFRFLEERFGIPRKSFDGYLLFRRGKAWWLFKDSEWLSAAAGFRIALAGLRAFQRIGEFIKPSTRFIQRFGPLATRAIVEIRDEELVKLLGGEALPMNVRLEDGYMILENRGCRLGLGLLINGALRSQLPRSARQFIPSRTTHSQR